MTRMLRGLCLIVCLILPVCSLELPRTAATVAGEWRIATPESEGVDSDLLAAAIESLRERRAEIHSLLLVRHGKLLAESYFYPYDGKVPHDIASVTKPITTTLVGLAINQGRIASVSEPMLSVFSGQPAANTDPRKQKVTIEHLMTMSSGLGCKAQAGEPTLWEMLSAADNLRFMLDLPMSDEPGSRYVYCSGGMHLLSGAVTRRTGLSAEAFARKNLFTPLGIRQWIWPRDPQKISHGFGNLHLLPRDMARIGQLFLDEGRWEGRQVVPAEWVAAATKPRIRTGGPGSSDYGYGWRIPTNGSPVAFEASGRGGQQISILKSASAVVVVNGGGFNSGELMKQIHAAIRSDRPLPENPTALARLQRAISAAIRPHAAVPVAPLPALASRISGRQWNLESNWLGLKSITLDFKAAQPGQTGQTARAALVFAPALKQYQFGISAQVTGRNSISETRPVGLDGLFRISPNGILGLPVGLRGNWIDDRTFQLEFNEIANTNTYFLRFTFDGERLRVEASEKTGLFKENFGGSPTS